jgi:hypothetical protein
MPKPRILLVFSYPERDVLAWPYRGFNFKKRIDELTEKLEKSCSGIDFIPSAVRNKEETEELIKQSNEFDGIVNYAIGSDSGTPIIIARSGKPAILVDDLYGAADDVLIACSFARRSKFPVIGVASSDFRDVVNSIKLLKIKKSLSAAKILIIADDAGMRRIPQYPSHLKEIYGPDQVDVKAQAERIKNLFGIEIVGMGFEEINNYYKNVSSQEAEKWADKWINEASKIVEPTSAEIIKSAKLFLALKKVIEDKNADAITIDCYGNFDKLPAYPCLAFFQLNNEGFTAVCEADLSSTIVQLLIRYLTKEMLGESRPGFVNDPVIDFGTGRIIYSHCTATNRVFGPNNPPNKYLIRSHAEMKEGVAVQSLMPCKEKITTIQIHFMGNPVMVIHQGKTVANEDVERGCRTKLSSKANVEKIWANWNRQGEIIVPAHWHRVTVYGDWRKQLQDLATLMEIDIFEEDKV